MAADDTTYHRQGTTFCIVICEGYAHTIARALSISYRPYGRYLHVTVTHCVDLLGSNIPQKLVATARYIFLQMCYD